MTRFWDWVQWLVIAALIVALAVNAKQWAPALATGGNVLLGTTGIIASGGTYQPKQLATG